MSSRNLFSSALTLRSLRRTKDAADGLPEDWPDDELEPLDVEAAADEATEASLSLLDSPAGDTLRFLRFLRGRPFSFGAGIIYWYFSVEIIFM